MKGNVSQFSLLQIIGKLCNGTKERQRSMYNMSFCILSRRIVIRWETKEPS